jgi:multidrug efflux pump subunit AcrA (membrane-fusion protein)
MVRPVPVALGAARAGTVEVRGDLQAGQLVVTRGNERLRPGMQVSFTP